MGVSAFPEPSPESTVTVRWDDGPYAGLAVVCRRDDVPTGMYLNLSKEAPDLDARAGRFRRFGNEVLLEWNLDDGEGEPIPATSEGMLSIPPALAWLIIVRWMDALIEVPGPLGVTSPAGEPSGAPSTAAAGKSSSRGSSRARK